MMSFRSHEVAEKSCAYETSRSLTCVRDDKLSHYLVDEQADRGAGGEVSWEAIGQRLAFYAKRFRSRLEAIR